jgi:hypothetical protein
LRKLFKVSIDGGTWVQLTSNESSVPVISPDGDLVATGYFDSPEGLGMAIYPISGGQPLKILDLWSPSFRWARDGRSILYVDRRPVANIISYPVRGGASRVLTNFKTGGIATFHWSHSGQLAWSRKIATADVVVLNDRRVR